MLSINLLCMILSKLIAIFIPRESQSMFLYTLAGITAQLFGVILFFIMLLRGKRFQYRFSFQGLFGTIRSMLPRIFHYGIPAGLESIIYLISQTIVVSFIGLLGTNALLAKGFAGNVTYYMALTTSATAAGSSIVVGQLIGAGKLKEIKRVSKKVIVLDFAVTALVGLILLLIGPKILRIYTTDSNILASALKVLYISMVLELIRCVTGNLIAILKATGDVAFPFAIIIIGSAINIGISYYLGIVHELGLAGIWLGYVADVFFRGVSGSIKFNWNMKRWKGRISMDFMEPGN
jgi:Na+-driven multidrug efflux pump